MEHSQFLVLVELLDSINTQLTRIADNTQDISVNMLSETGENTPADSLWEISRVMQKYTGKEPWDK